MKKILAILSGLAVVMSLTSGAYATPGNEHKITICHATSSATNPYVSINVDVSSLNGHGDHAGDIFAATGEWPAQGDQAVLANGCKPVVVVEPPDDDDVVTPPDDDDPLVCPRPVVGGPAECFGDVPDRAISSKRCGLVTTVFEVWNGHKYVYDRTEHKTIREDCSGPNDKPIQEEGM